MLEKIALWCILIGISFLVDTIGWTSQGEAFITIVLGGLGIFSLFASLICLLMRTCYDEKERFLIPSLILLTYIIVISIFLLTTWGVYKAFDVDFYIAFQIVTLIYCIVTPSRA